ncbi:MAG: hypothetical protein Q7S22_07595 [Candidatus Micrarchaeota archaeon]|nr:hypothetical protein [Candidatus Micrarchaeota archaeon]
MELRYYLPFLIIIALTATLIYSFFLHTTLATEMPLSTKLVVETTICKSGDSEPCKINSCSGTIRCVNGIWGGCIVPQVCIPEEKINCYAQTCSIGKKTCNECGTGYGSCVFADT